jgi:aminoglycoside 6-adenylyltransferase
LFDGITSSYQIPPKDDRVPLPPTAAEFDHVVSGFLMAAATTAKFIMRGDLWRAQTWFAQDLRPHLLTMIRWHAYGEGKDLWYGARFIEQWADPRIVAQLGNAFPDYDADSLKTALIDLFDLFGWVSEETAVRFRFSYSITGHRKIEALIEQIFAEET